MEPNTREGVVGKSRARTGSKLPRPTPFAKNDGSPAFEFFSKDGAGLGERKSMDAILRAIGIVRPTQGGSSEVENPLTDSWVVYACVQARARACAGIPFKLWESADPDAAEVGEGHPLRRLLNEPTPDMDFSDLISAGSIHRQTSGEDWWFLYDSNGEPVFPIPEAAGDASRALILPDWANPRAKIPLPRWIVPASGDYVGDQRDARSGRVLKVWYNTGGTTQLLFGVASTCHFFDYDPREPQRGLAPADVALRAISLGFQAERYQESVLRGGGPGAFVSFEDQMSNDEERRVQEEINESVRDPNVVGGLKVLSGKVKIEPNPATPKEMLQTETLDWVRDVVCSVFQVAPPVIGVYDDATYNNLEGAYRQFYQGVRAYLDAVARKINRNLIGRLSDAALARCVLTFDYSGIAALAEDQSDEIKLAVAISKDTGLSFAEACEVLELEVEIEPDSGANTAFVSTTQRPLEQALAGPDPAPAGGAGDGSAGANSEDPETPEAPAKSAELSVTRAARAPALSAEERSAYHDQLMLRVSARQELRLSEAAYVWLARYEREQRRRIRLFCERGPNARSAAGAETKSTPPTEAEIDQFLLLHEEKWRSTLAAASEPAIEAAYLGAIADIAREIGVVAIDMSSPAVVAALSKQTTQLAEGVTSRLAAEVRSIILEALAAGGGMEGAPLQARLVEALPELEPRLAAIFGTKEARANTIARTEIGHAVSSARIEQMRAAGITRIQWISSRDDAVRPSHRDLDGQERQIGEEFKAGLRWPCDERGPAGEVINCRCVPKPIVPE